MNVRERNTLIKRTKVRLQVLKGYNPTAPEQPQFLAPPKENDIQSGQCVELADDGGDIKLQHATDPGSKTVTLAFALADAQDPSVMGSGQLVALPTNGDFVLQSPFFKDDEVYSLGTELTWDATEKHLKPAGPSSLVVGVINMEGKVPTSKAIDLKGTVSSVVDEGLHVIQFHTVQPYYTAAS